MFLFTWAILFQQQQHCRNTRKSNARLPEFYKVSS